MAIIASIVKANILRQNGTFQILIIYIRLQLLLLQASFGLLTATENCNSEATAQTVLLQHSNKLSIRLLSGLEKQLL